MASPLLADFDRVDHVNHCLKAISSFCDVFFNKIPIAQYVDISFVLYSYFSHNLMSLYSLSILDDPAWDKNAVRNAINILDVCDTFISKLNQVACVSGLILDESHSDMFSKSSRIMTCIRDTWAAEMESGRPRTLEELYQPLPPMEDATSTQDFTAINMTDDVWYGDTIFK
jgi:hypothetical protein